MRETPRGRGLGTPRRDAARATWVERGVFIDPARRGPGAPEPRATPLQPSSAGSCGARLRPWSWKGLRPEVGRRGVSGGGGASIYPDPAPDGAERAGEARASRDATGAGSPPPARGGGRGGPFTCRAGPRAVGRAAVAREPNSTSAAPALLCGTPRSGPGEPRAPRRRCRPEPTLRGGGRRTFGEERDPAGGPQHGSRP